MLPNFKLTLEGIISQKFLEKNIFDFHGACEYVKSLPKGRNSSNTDFVKLLEEQKGTCATKHALLNQLALENNQNEIELMFGIYLISSETHTHLTNFFLDKKYAHFPETHCYLRYKGIRYDYSSQNFPINQFESTIVREQRIDPNQVGEWKTKIHQDYLIRWLKRNPLVNSSIENIWQDREKIQKLLSY